MNGLDFIRTVEERDVELLNQLAFNSKRYERLSHRQLKMVVADLEKQERDKIRKGTHGYSKSVNKRNGCQTAKLKRL